MNNGRSWVEYDPECKIPVLNTQFRCGGCGLPFLKEVVKYAAVSGYDDGVEVGICVECQALFNLKDQPDES